jgi:phage baseplate assembly protein W
MPNLIGYKQQFNSRGSFLKIVNSETLVQDLIAILSIKKGTYINNPNLGSSLTDYIFMPSDSLTYKSIQNDIISASQYLNSNITLDVNSIQLQKTSDNQGLIVSFQVNINNQYSQNISLLVSNQTIIAI